MSSTVSLHGAVFESAQTGHHTVRIPAVISTDSRRGSAVEVTLLAFAEGRIHSAGDAGEIEVIVRRSTDGGVSWSPMQVVSRAAGMTCGNPVPIADPGSGDVVLLTTRNAATTTEDALTRWADPEAGRRIFCQRSPDQGRSWTEPVEITASVKPAHWGWYATGPGHGIALQHGPHAGRLVAPANHSVLPGSGERPDPSMLVRRNGAHGLLSDDGGHSWRVGFIDHNDGERINPNESTVAELPDGTLYCNARNHRGTGSARVQARSVNGGETLLAPFAEIAQITAPGVQGSVLAIGDRLLLSTPADPDRRRGLTVFVSDDAGEHWRAGTVVHLGPAGYSDLVALPDGQAGVLYEAGDGDDASSFANIRFATFDPTHL